MSKYIDIPACLQVIGAAYSNPNILDDPQYSFNTEDFPEEFHQIIFGSIYNLHSLGVEQITGSNIEDYLQTRPKKLAIYQLNKGTEFLQKLSSNTQMAAFNYYYNRMKKMTLFRMYKYKLGLDLAWLYDSDNILDAKKRQEQEDWLDNTSIEDIADLIDKQVLQIRSKYVADKDDIEFVQAGSGIKDLITNLQKNPDFGYPMYGPLINTVFRGARLGKFYLRSAATNVGKTRLMVADAAYIGCDEIYDTIKQEWVSSGSAEPTMLITTEQKTDELQTMILAFLSGVPESHILENTYTIGEFDRVLYAAEVMERSPLYLRELPDFSLGDIELNIQTGLKEHKIKYVFLDYIHSSMKILSEISSKSKVAGLREDNILFLIGVKLKDIAVENDVFILSSTQLNGQYVTSDTPDQNLLRGAKSLGDKVDAGMIVLRVTEEDKTFFVPFCDKNGYEYPTVKISVYKNRRGEYNHFFLWCVLDLGTCRIKPIFATEYDYTVIAIEDTKIRVFKEDEKVKE